MLRFEGGARGAVSVSQVSAGRQEHIQYEIDGSSRGGRVGSESPDHLWIGHRGRPNEILQRDPRSHDRARRAAARLPGGHVEGFAGHVRGPFLGNLPKT